MNMKTEFSGHWEELRFKSREERAQATVKSMLRRCAEVCRARTHCSGLVLIEEDAVCQIKENLGHDASLFVIRERRRHSLVKLGAAAEHVEQVARAKQESFTTAFGGKECASVDAALNATDTRVYVSLTTIPSRISGIGETLRTILDQTLVPDAVFVSVPLSYHRFQKAFDTSEKGSTSLAAEKAALEASPHWVAARALWPHAHWVQFLFSQEDFGPATKLVVARRMLQERGRPNDIIITVDDDNGYFPLTVFNLVKASLSHPDAILCHMGYDLQGAPYTHPNFHYYDNVGHAFPVHIVGGFQGVLYRARFFATPKFHDILAELLPEFPEGRWVDDDYISGIAAKLGVKRLIVPQLEPPVYYQVPRQSSDANALSSGANKHRNIQRQTALLTNFVKKGYLPGPRT